MTPHDPLSALSRRRFLAGAAATVGAAALPGLPALHAAEGKAEKTEKAEKPAAKKLVLIAGRPSHGPGDHEFHAGCLLLKKCLADTPELDVAVHNMGWPKDGEKALEGAAGVLIYADGGGGHPALQGDHAEVIKKLLAKGVGLMCAHFAVEVPKDRGDVLREWIGGAYEHQFSCNPMWSPEYKTFPDHEIARGVKPFSVKDEWYFNMRFREDGKGVTPILSAVPSDAVRDGPYVYPKGPYPHIQTAKGRAETMMWAYERPDGGRGVGFTGGHVHRNWGNDDFRKVVLNALLWICKVPVPAEGVKSSVEEALLGENLDPKGKKK
jgi:hypothetical protein